MSLLGGIMRSVINPMTIAQLAMGPAGWASLAMKAAISAIGQQVIQQLGQQLGLPQSMISAATTAFGQASGFGNIGGLSSLDQTLRAAGLNAFERGSIMRDVTQQMRQVERTMQSENTQQSIQDFIDGINRNNENNKMKNQIDKVMNGKGSLLMKLAVALGMLADKKMNDMADKTKELGQFGEVTGKNQGKYAQLTGEIQALGQEMAMISQAMSNVIKTVGEAASTLARKG